MSDLFSGLEFFLDQKYFLPRVSLLIEQKIYQLFY